MRQTDHTDNVLLKLININLHTKNLRVLKDINFGLERGSIHAVLGGTGSGKSSFGMIMTGAIRPKTGKILFEESEYSYLTLKKSHQLGIEMFYQNLYIFDSFLVAEALMLPTKYDHILQFMNKSKVIDEAQSFLVKYGFQIDASVQLKDLKPQDQLLISLLKTIYQKPKLIILDEPFKNLSPSASKKIMKLLYKLKYEDGMSILLLTNSIDEIHECSDFITLLKDGEVLLSDSAAHIERSDLIRNIYNDIAKKTSIKNIKQEFYQLIKYNISILQNLPINLIVTDQDNNIKLVNEHSIRHLNLENRNILNTPIEPLFQELNHDIADLIKTALSERKKQSFINIMLTIDGRETINNITLNPIMDGSYFVGNIIIIEDITEKEKLREQIFFTENMSSVGLLAAGVAHEINNPLEIIYNYTNFIKLHLQKSNLMDVVNSLEEEVQYIASIIDNLMTFSSSGTKFFQELDLNETITNLIDLIRYNAEKRKVNIHFTPRSPSIKLNADGKEIKLVMLNLIKNSFEAMPTGGSLEIETKEVEFGDKRQIQISVRDSGKGIDEENEKNVFLPFYSTKTRNGTNLGLGLYVCFTIIKRYSGSLSVRNLEDAGCEFTITLPSPD